MIEINAYRLTHEIQNLRSVTFDLQEEDQWDSNRMAEMASWSVPFL
jgi:hypothetical protein